MATGTKSNTPAPAKKAAAKRPAAAKAGKFNPADLPETGKGQYRQQGDGQYKPSIKALLAFAKGDDKNRAHVKALIHLGWVKPGGENLESKSGACKVASEGGLTASQWTLGKDAAPQIAANMTALAEAGAPEDALNDLWAVYAGKNTDVL